MAPHERKWWKEATVYQIYPSTFLDTNGDGVGDLQGIVQKLPYLRSLGIDVIWLSPHYKSPQIDMGYDISSFEDIHAPYGSMKDCEELIEATHAHGMKIIFDLVINHVSDQHPWFLESRSSKDSKKRDWFFWRPAKLGPDGERMAPNNWRSQFTVPSWTWDEVTQEYYFHIYAPQMPDLNWEKPECRRAIYDSAIRFWLDRGVDGFRIDVVNKYSKDVTFPDAEIIDPTEITQPAMKYYSNGPRMREFLLEMNDVFDEYNIMTVGETPFTPLERDVMGYVSAAKRQLNMVFNFDFVSLGQTPGNRLVPRPFTVKDMKHELSRWQTFVNNTDAWTTVFTDNHDQGRSVSRFGSDATEELRVRNAKMFAMVLVTMTGTLFLYQGQEIGMINIPKSWGAEEYKDVRSVNFYNHLKQRLGGDPDHPKLKEALAGMQRSARDNARLPMQWSDAPNTGFSREGATPWMRVHDGYRELNVARQEVDEGSVLEFWKMLLKRRKEMKDLWIYGVFEVVDVGVDAVFIFVKTFDGGAQGGGKAARRSVTIANMGGEQQDASPWLEKTVGAASCTIGNMSPSESSGGDILAPWEARIYVDAA